MQTDNKPLKAALNAVILGYNLTNFENRKVFIKHFSYKDKVEVDYEYEAAYKESVDRRIITEEEKLRQIKANGLWSDAEDKQITTLTNQIEDFKRKKRNILPSQIPLINGKIDDCQRNLNQLKFKKIKLLGVTAESIASNRAEDFYIMSSFFEDKEFKIPLVKETFDEVDIDYLSDLKNCYFIALKHVLGDGLKKLSVLSDFMNMMFLAEKPYEIFNKALVDYSFFQIELISYARNYKYILSQDPPPHASIKEDPYKLDDWFESSQGLNKRIEKMSDKEDAGGATMVMGATKQDLEALKSKGDVKNIDTEIKNRAKNGVLSMEEMMKIHGVKS